MTTTRVALVNCKHHEGACLAGHFGGRPSPATCELVCKVREARDANAPAVTYQVGVAVCLGDRNRYTADAWIAMEDARTGFSGKKMIVPLAVYQAAQKHRIDDDS